MSAPAGDEQGRVSVPLLSGVLPLALVAMAVLVGSRLVALNEQGLIAAGREHSTQFLNQELMELHAWLDAGRPPEELKTQLQVMALDSAVQTLAVIGGDHTVLASNHTLDAGAPASVLRGYDAAVATRASEGRSGLVVSDGGALVQEYVPIAVPSGRSASVPVLLYGTLDLTNEFAKLRAASWNSSARLLALVAASVLLLSALLNEAVIRRLRAVVAAMEGLARGDLASRSPVVGDDEIGAVGRAFNTMAGHVQQQHDQLVRSQARYQQVVEGSDDLVLVTTLLGQVLFVNQASVRMLGLEPEECLGRSVYEFVAPEDAQVAAEWAASVLDNGLERSNAEFRVVHRDGSRRFVLVNSRRVRDSGGLDGPDRQGSPGEHFEHFVRDRTEVLQAEAERRRMEEQVAHSERMSVIGQLAGGVAHDFNNQLAGILGYAELLAMRLPEGPLRSYAQRIEASAQHSAELTRKLLALSRRGKYREQAVDLHAVLDDVAGILRHSIDPRIEVKLDLQAGSAWVIGDGSQLQSAILNLGVNARDAMPDGGCLTLRSRESEGTSPAPPPHPESKRYLEIEVVDTGVGMDEQTLAQAFEPFFTTKAVGAGTGLGLPAVYGTVLAHRGTMHLDSAPGRGTSCRLWLPLADAPSAQEDSGRRTEGTGAGARILVVDDEAPVRDMLGEMLESAGFVVTACAGGVDALSAWKEAAAPFDLVILDLMMPGMNGAEFLAELLQLAPQARVLLLSGYADEGTTRQMMAAGAKGLLSKPCPRATLLEEVERVLSDAA